MSVINSQPLIGASGNQGAAYNLTRSIRLRNSASAYLSRTPAGSGSLTTFTFSTWVKRGRLDIDGYLFSAVKSSPTATDAIRFNSNGSFGVFYEGSATVHVRTSSVYRDPSAWYHVVVQIDSTQATASNRIKIYINGSQVTSLDITNYPSQNATFPAWNRAVLHTIGNDAQLALYADQYMAETHFIDGQYLDASSFGETDTATGVWKPKKYTGTYGTNGFYLKFDNITSTSTLGNDSSGNGNTWTVNNISLTSGVTYDSMTDVPTLTDADTANYCVLNPLKTTTAPTNGNLTIVGTGGDFVDSIYGTMAVTSSGKYYFEVTGAYIVGINSADVNPSTNQTTGRLVYHGGAGLIIDGSTTLQSGLATLVSTDVTGIAINLDAGTLAFYKNNSQVGTNVTITTTNTWFPFVQNPNQYTAHANFGQRPFAYTPPSGFKALNTFNLPTPTIGATASTQANKYFDVKTYTGTGSSLNITGLGFQPDLVWIKERNAAADHALYDAVRGVQKQLESNTTDAETTESTGLTAFNSDGFTVGALAQVNTNTDTYVAWAWDANGAGSSNTSGTITSTVSANTSAGFSIVTWTMPTSGVSTVGHGLGVAPAMIIMKARTGSVGWAVYHQSIGNNAYIRLDTTGTSTSDANAWNNTSPTSSVFTIGTSFNNLGTYVAYCFAEVAGYSKFGSYTGNNNADGPFIYLGFRPKFVLFKASNNTSGWMIADSSRSPTNVSAAALFPNSANAEYTIASDVGVDFLSNGVKIRGQGGETNFYSGGTFIYAAFAEVPQKFSLAR